MASQPDSPPFEPSASGETPVRRKGCWGCLSIVISVPLLLLAWCHHNPSNRFPPEALAALENDPKAALFSIDPWPDDQDDESVGFLGHRIMGQITLASAEDRRFFARALDDSTRGAWDRSACFDPRHAFSANGPAGTYEFLVCFSCGQTLLHMPDGTERWVLISGESEEFNRFLKEHKIPLAER